MGQFFQVTKPAKEVIRRREKRRLNGEAQNKDVRSKMLISHVCNEVSIDTKKKR